MEITRNQLDQALAALEVPVANVNVRETGIEITFTDARLLYCFWTRMSGVLDRLASPFSVNDLINEVATEVHDSGVTLTFENVTVSGHAATNDDNGDDDANDRLGSLESQMGEIAAQVNRLVALASERLGVTV